MKGLSEKQAELQAKQVLLARIFEQAGAELDLEKADELKRFATGAERVAEVKRLNDDLVRLGQEIETMQAVELAAKQTKDRGERWSQPNGTVAVPNEAPYVKQFPETDRYDNLAPDEHAYLVVVAEELYRKGQMKRPISDAAVQALALKTQSEAKNYDYAARGAKLLPRNVKANEINRSTLANYGDDWAGVQYSTSLWEAIRAGSWVVNKIPQSEIPKGYESNIIPLESVDPTWYKVAQAADTTSGVLTQPTLTVSASLIGTAKKTVTVGKMGCRVLYTGEVEEDSLIDWVPNAMRQIRISGAEQMEYVVIDGDESASSNINDIGGTTYSGVATTLFLLTDGLRHLPLITNTANARDGGAIAAADVASTVMLMGVAGKSAADPSKVSFVCDPWTFQTVAKLPEVYTRDVYPNPTLERGIFNELNVLGYMVRPSWYMHYAGIHHGTVTTAGYQLKANNAGKIDQDTQTNNSLGALLAVRWDQWVLKWKRRMTIETTRQAASDTTEVVAMMRWGLGYRDIEAAAISYNLTIA